MGDAGSLLRMHKLLTTWGLVNGNQIGESAPSHAALLRRTGGSQGKEKKAIAGGGSSAAAVVSGGGGTAFIWTAERIEALEASVVRHAYSNKRRRTEEGSTAAENDDTSLDWDAVASEFGNGVVSAAECQRAFLQPPPPVATTDGSISARSSGATSTAAPPPPQNKEAFFSEILNSVHPTVLRATIDASRGEDAAGCLVVGRC